MEKKTIMPQKNKKHIFIENLIFCILVIVTCIVGVCTWVYLQVKQQDILNENSDTLVLSEDTQKDMYYDNSTNTYYNDNLVSFNSLSSYNSTNTYYVPNFSVPHSSYGLGGNSFVSYLGTGTGLPLIAETYEVYNENDDVTYSFNYRWLDLYYDVDTYLFNHTKGDYNNTIIYPLLFTNNDDLVYRTNSNYTLLFTFNIVGSYNNGANTTLCSFDFVSNFFNGWEGEFFTGNIYNEYTLNEHIDIDYSGYFFTLDTYLNDIISISRIDVSIYFNSNAFEIPLNCDNLNGCYVGLYCSCTDYFNYILDGYFDMTVFDDFVSYLPNYKKFVDYSTYETTYNNGYNNGYNVGKTDGLEIGYQNGSTDGYYQGYQQGLIDGPSTSTYSNTYRYALNSYLSKGSEDDFDFTGVLNMFNNPGAWDRENFDVDNLDGNTTSDLQWLGLEDFFSYTLSTGGRYHYLIHFATSITNLINFTFDIPTNYNIPFSLIYEDGSLESFNSATYGSDLQVSISLTKKVVGVYWCMTYGSLATGYDGLLLQVPFNNIEYNNGYNVGKTDGYQEGYNQGSTDGYYQGRLVGYNQGLNANNESGRVLTSLFTSVSSVPISIFNGLMPARVLGIPILEIFFGLLALALILWLIRRFI